jgi:signal transduction histidine kinase
MKLESRIPEARANGRETSRSRNVLIFAPTGNDGRMTATFLAEHGRTAKVCTNMAEVCAYAEEWDMILLAEETLDPGSIALLTAMLSRQPAWSDIPITIITSSGEVSQDRLRKLASLGSGGNVGLLERPFRRGTLLSAVDVALRSRQRQHQVRVLLEEIRQAQVDLERLVKERTAQLTETNAQLETLVYSIAHDLRAPLRSMQAFGKMLLEDYSPQLDKDAQFYTQRIVHSAETMDTLVLDLLNYGRMARAEIKLESVSPEMAWQMAVSQYEQEISDKKAMVRALPPFHSVLAHSATLSQVFANLLGNALKFTTPGEVPHVLFSSTVANGRVRLHVMDNGIGIAPEYHEKVFQVFERLENNTEGTGIGLAIVRKGVERMGGKVGLESGGSRKGSLFWIELPESPPES